MHHRTSTDATHLSRCDNVPLYLLARKSQRASSHITTCIIAHRPMRFTSRCAICTFVSLGQKNHNMHHRTSTDAIRQSMCDMYLCISWPENHNMHHRTSTESIRQSMCDIPLYLSRPEKSQHASSHIDRFDSSVDVRYVLLYLLARNITTCIIAHQPMRLACRGAIMYLCISWPEISQHASSHINRCDSPVEVR